MSRRMISTTIMRDRVATGPGPVAHPASRSMTSPAPSVIVMIRPAADETTIRDGCVRWPKQARHILQMDGFVCEVKSLQWRSASAPARPSGRDGVMASPPPPRRRWLPEGAGAARFIQHVHVLTTSTVMHDHKCTTHNHKRS